MAVLVREAAASEESLAAVARRHGIPAQRLYWWRRRLGQRQEAPRRMVPVSIQDGPTPFSGGIIEIETAGGDTIRAPSCMAAEQVAGLVAALIPVLRRC